MIRESRMATVILVSWALATALGTLTILELWAL